MTRIPAGKMEYHSLPSFYLNTIHFTDCLSYKATHHLQISNWLFNRDYKSLTIFLCRLQIAKDGVAWAQPKMGGTTPDTCKKLSTVTLIRGQVSVGSYAAFIDTYGQLCNL